MRPLGAAFGLFSLSALLSCGDSERQGHPPGGSSEAGASGAKGDGGSPENSTGGTSAVGDGGSPDAGASGSFEEAGGAGGADNAGGQGPGGQPGCGPLEEALCDDGNDCTEDACTGSGCLHVAAADGAACDDGNACTSGDQCEAGQCTGAPLESLAEVGGLLRSFASAPMQIPHWRNRGLSLALNEELLVFTERGPRRGYGAGLELVLVRKVGGELEVVDRVPTSFSSVENISVGYFPARFGLHLVRLNDQRFVLVGRGELSGTDLEIYDADASGLSLVGERDFFFDGVGSVMDAEGHDDRLWLLNGSDIVVYEIDPDGEPTWLARFGTVASASAFAASEDHQLLYVGSQQGTFRIDVSDLANPIVDESPVIPEDKERRPYQMTLQGDLLFIQSEGLFTIGHARLYAGPDWKLLRRFQSTTAVDSPLGGAFTEDGLLLQRLLYEGSKPSELRAELYSLDGGEVTLSDSSTYADLRALEIDETDTGLVPYSPTAQGSLAILGPSRRVVSTDGGLITELRGALQGGFDSVHAADAGSVLAFGRQSGHRVALEPTGPSLVAGGLFPPGTSALQSLVFSDAEGSLSGLRYPLLVSPQGARESRGRLAWLETGAQGTLEPKGFFELPGAVPGYAWHVATERLLFRLERSQEDSSGMLRVYALPATPGELGAVEALDPLLLPAEGDAYLVGFAVEPTGEAFAVARSNIGTEEILLARYERDGESYGKSSDFAVSSKDALDGLLMRGDRVVLLHDDKQALTLLGHDEAGFHQITTRKLETKSGGTFSFRALLGIEGSRLYLGNGREDEVEPGVLPVVDVLDLSDLTDVASYVMPQEMTSFSASGETLVFVGPSALATAAPECGP